LTKITMIGNDLQLDDGNRPPAARTARGVPVGVGQAEP